MIERTNMGILLLILTQIDKFGIGWMGCKDEVDQLQSAFSFVINQIKTFEMQLTEPVAD